MKNSESISRKETPEEELKRLRKENRSLKSNLGKANDKLKRAKGELKQTKAELNNKDVTKTTLSKEQKKLLSTLFPDIDIRFW